MSVRRLEKIARVIQESVSTTLLTRLSDPRIQGLVTVTEVEVSPDLRQATVFLSVLSADEATQRRTLAAIQHAAGVFQTCLGKAMTCRYVPHLRFEADRKLHNTLQTLQLIEQVRKEWDPQDPSDGPEYPDAKDDQA